MRACKSGGRLLCACKGADRPKVPVRHRTISSVIRKGRLAICPFASYEIMEIISHRLSFYTSLPKAPAALSAWEQINLGAFCVVAVDFRE